MNFLPSLAYLSGNSILEIALIGIIAGLLLDVCLRGKSYGFLGNSLVGFVGAIIGGFVWEKTIKQYVKIDLGSAEIQLIMVLVALLGTLLLLLLVNVIMKNRKD
ncbi:MAG: hypothetical protein P1U89_14345 [Verrucomicrobiales bacterium]|nr:hypothetical protein [Verrucomicrobiales bacterium]